MKNEYKGLIAAIVATMVAYAIYFLLGNDALIGFLMSSYVFYWYDKFNKKPNE